MYNFGSIPFFASNNNLVEKNRPGTPSCIVSPSLTGEPVPGVLMRANIGSWTNDPTGYGYSWYLDDVFISSENSYEITERDPGKYIKCIIRAANSNGRSLASTRSVLIRGI